MKYKKIKFTEKRKVIRLLEKTKKEIESADDAKRAELEKKIRLH